MPDVRHCMICGGSVGVKRDREDVEIWLCGWCCELAWVEILTLLVKEREVCMLRDIAREMMELGTAVDGLRAVKRRSGMHYKVPGCKAHIPEGG